MSRGSNHIRRAAAIGFDRVAAPTAISRQRSAAVISIHAPGFGRYDGRADEHLRKRPTVATRCRRIAVITTDSCPHLLC